MRDDHDQPTGSDPFQRREQPALRLGVERRRRFIQDQYPRIAHEPAGDAQALLLADGQGVAGTAEHGVDALR